MRVELEAWNPLIPLEPDDSGEPVDHPLVSELLGAFENGRYCDLDSVH